MPLSIASPELNASATTARALWSNQIVRQVHAAEGDGACFLLHMLPNEGCGAEISAQIVALLASVRHELASAPGEHLIYATLPLLPPQEQSPSTCYNPTALLQPMVCDALVLMAFDACLHTNSSRSADLIASPAKPTSALVLAEPVSHCTTPTPNVQNAAILTGISAYTKLVPKSQLILALGWHGWDYPCSSSNSSSISISSHCEVRVPAGSTWLGWVQPSSHSFLLRRVAMGKNSTPFVLDTAR